MTIPKITVENGLLTRWCNVGCRHHIRTREMTWDTNNCENFHRPAYFSWRQSELNQADILRWLQHIPHCAKCLGDNNSYGFPAWYDLSAAKVQRFAELYRANYPADWPQPLFFPWGDDTLEFRLPDVNIEGELDLNSLIVCFSWQSYCPPGYPDNDPITDPEQWSEAEFDLSQPVEWRRLLREFPLGRLK